MSNVEKEFVELTSLKRKDFETEEDYITAILEYCSVEIDEEDLGEMSAEASTWFNANVDAISEEDGKLIPFDALDPEDAPFGEDDEEEAKEDEGEEVEGEEVEMKDLEVGDKVAIVLKGDEIEEGEVIKVMKVAVKIVDGTGEEKRISSKKIETIYKLAEEESTTEEETKEKTIEEVAETMEEVKEDGPITKKMKKAIEATKDDGGKVFATGEQVEEMKEAGIKVEMQQISSRCKCSSNPGNAKEILFHVSEILRLIKDMM